jgi:hypothetical protein
MLPPSVDPPPPSASAVTTASDTSKAPSGGSLLDGYRATAEQIERALSTETDPKMIASLSTTLNRTRWHIGQLTGEAQLTENKILRSEAWRNVLTRIEQIASKHPDAAVELAAYFESLET